MLLRWLLLLFVALFLQTVEQWSDVVRGITELQRPTAVDPKPDPMFSGGAERKEDILAKHSTPELYDALSPSDRAALRELLPRWESASVASPDGGLSERDRIDLELADRVDNSYMSTLALQRVVKSAERRGDLDAAIEYARQALAAAEGPNLRAIRTRSLSLLLLRNGQRAEATALVRDLPQPGVGGVRTETDVIDVFERANLLALAGQPEVAHQVLMANSPDGADPAVVSSYVRRAGLLAATLSDRATPEAAYGLQMAVLRRYGEKAGPRFMLDAAQRAADLGHGDTAASLRAVIVEHYPGTHAAGFVRLTRAQEAIEARNLPAAAEQLREVRDDTRLPETLRAQARGLLKEIGGGSGTVKPEPDPVGSLPDGL